MGKEEIKNQQGVVILVKHKFYFQEMDNEYMVFTCRIEEAKKFNNIKEFNEIANKKNSIDKGGVAFVYLSDAIKDENTEIHNES